MDLQSAEITRYSRHLPLIGLEGQLKLKQAKVLCVGAGGLGCPALQYLAACGVGTLGIIDGDVVELSNLQRQILFTELDVGKKKAEVAKTRLQSMNQHIQIEAIHEFLTKKDAKLIQHYDVILDATDNYKARYELNHLCRSEKKPLVSASLYQYEAQLSVFNHLDGPCYQCLYPEPPPPKASPNCALAGVLGVLPGVAGALQATEAIKIILGLPSSLSGQLLCIDLLTLHFNQFQIQKKKCSEHPQVTFKPSEQSFGISPKELQHVLKINGDFIQLIDVREQAEREDFHIGGVHIPLATLKGEIHRFDQQKPIIIYCKAGVRSLQALHLFLEAGFSDVRQLEGGILAWRGCV